MDLFMKKFLLQGSQSVKSTRLQSELHSGKLFALINSDIWST